MTSVATSQARAAGAHGAGAVRCHGTALGPAAAVAGALPWNRGGPVAPVALPRARLWAATLVGVQLLLVLDGSVTTVALPVIEHGLRVGASAAQWLITGYAAAFGGLLVLGGRVADRFGPRRVISLGLSGFVAASAVSALAPDLVVLTLARVVQGAAAAGVVPASLALVATTFEDPQRRRRVLGAIGSAVGAGFVLGQTGGGLLADGPGWRSVFVLNVVFAALLLLGARTLPRDRPRTRQPVLDLTGAALLTGTVVLLVQALAASADHGLRSPALVVPLAAAALLAPATLLQQRRSPAPLVPRGLLGLPGQGVSNGVSLAFGAVIGAGALLPTLVLEQVRGLSAVEAGLLFAPQGLAGLLAGPATARLAQRLAPRSLLVVAPLLSGAGLAGLALALRGGSPPVFTVLAMAVVGVGNTATAVLTTFLGTDGVPAALQGVAGGVRNTLLQLGIALGTSAAVTTAKAVGDVLGTGNGGGGGYRGALALTAAAAVVTGVVVAPGARSRRPA